MAGGGISPISLTLIASGVVVAGTWSKEGKINTRQVIGVATLSFFMVIMSEAAPDMAKQFGWLLVAATLGAYGEDLFTAIGDATTKATTGADPEPK